MRRSQRDGRGSRARLRLAGALAAVGLLAAAGGCKASNTINTRSAEDAIAAKLQTLNPDAGTFTVTCPPEIPAEQGATFTCNVKGQDGTTLNVVCTQTDDKGTFDIKPETPLPSTPSTAGG